MNEYSNDNDNSEELAEVELENDSAFKGKNTISNFSYSSVLITFLFFIIFESGYVYTAMKAPSFTNVTNIDYPLSNEFRNKISSIQIIISPLTKYHKYLKMGISLINYPENKILYQTVDFNVSKTFLHFDSILNTSVTSSRSMFIWKSNNQVSNMIPIFNEYITNFNALNVSLTVLSNLHETKSIRLTYTFCEANLIKFQAAVMGLLFFSAIYALVGFLYSVHYSSFTFLDYICLIYSILLICSSNPFGIIINHPFIDIITNITSRFYLCFLQFFFIATLYSTFYSTKDYPFSFMLSNSIFFILYYLAYIFSDNISNSISSFILIGFHITYAIISISLTIKSFFSSSPFISYKGISFGIFNIVCCIITLWIDVFLRLYKIPQYSNLKNLVYYPTHILTGIIFIFFQYIASSEYHNIENDNSSVQTIADIDNNAINDAD